MRWAMESVSRVMVTMEEASVRPQLVCVCVMPKADQTLRMSGSGTAEPERMAKRRLERS